MTRGIVRYDPTLHASQFERNFETYRGTHVVVEPLALGWLKEFRPDESDLPKHSLGHCPADPDALEATPCTPLIHGDRRQPLKVACKALRMVVGLDVASGEKVEPFYVCKYRVLSAGLDIEQLTDVDVLGQEGTASNIDCALMGFRGTMAQAEGIPQVEVTLRVSNPDTPPPPPLLTID